MKRNRLREVPFFSRPKFGFKVSGSLSWVFLATSAVLLSSCGTTYDLPSVGSAETQRAAEILVEVRSGGSQTTQPEKSAKVLINQYLRVVKRVEPVAEKFCRQHKVDRKGFNCDVQILTDANITERNAYQSYDSSGNPIIVISLPLILDSRNEDELAFILGHEFGHHISEHLNKKEKQAIAGAIAMGLLTAYGQYFDANSSSYSRQQKIENSVAAGYVLGQRAYSQSYELESDVIGTHIAEASGYDPVRGARFFARVEPIRSSSGALSFWGTHPPSDKRLATVISAANTIADNRSGVPNKEK